MTADEDVADWELQRIHEARNTGSPLIRIRGVGSSNEDITDIRASQLSLVSLTAQGMGNVARYPSVTLDTQL